MEQTDNPMAGHETAPTIESILRGISAMLAENRTIGENNTHAITNATNALLASNERIRALENFIRTPPETATNSHNNQSQPVVPAPTAHPVEPAPVRTSYVKSRLPDPEKFNGEDASQFPIFQQNIRAKLAVDAAAIGGSVEQAYYVYGRLTGKAAVRLLPWISTTESMVPGSLSVENMMVQLEKAFADPNLRTKAITKLMILRQKGREIGEFLAEFEQHVIQAGGILWSDDVKVGYLQNALNPRLLQGLVGTRPTESYADFCNQLRLVEEQLDRAHRATRFTPGRSYPTSATTSNHNRSSTTPMDWEPTKVGAIRTEGNGARRRAPRVDRQEIERRRTNRLCIRCGGEGHFINKCRFLPPEMPRTSRDTQVAAIEGELGESDEEGRTGKE